MKSIFKDKEFWNRLLPLALPMAFQALMLASVAAADALMLGKLNQDSMSAVSLATQFQFLQNVISSSLIAGVGVLAAQYWGKKDQKSIDEIFMIGLRLTGLVSVLSFIGCFFFPRYIMLVFTDEEVLIEIGVRYLKIAAWSYLLTGFSQMYLTMMKISDHAGMTAKVSTAAVLINIGLNAVFIFGLLGAPKMGVQGAALATVIARIVELLWCVILSYRKNYIAPKFGLLFKFNRLLNKDYWKCTIPLLGAYIVWSVGFTSYSAFMGHLGTDAAAANSVCAVVRDLVCSLCEGLSRGGGVLLGVLLGAGELEKGKQFGIKLMKVSFFTGFLCTGIMLLLTPLLMRFVSLTPEASELLLGMMLVMSFYMIGRTVNTIIINGIFDAGGDTMFDFYSLAVTMWGLAVPLAFLGTFVFNWHPVVVYAFTCLDEVGKIPWVMVHFKKYKWVKDLTRKEG